jgi:alkanesulfonate monooxygenase SsuD/methylene tetrahydromethanopterin reductase-like flavin-dependent oxidoreductase (luciferase family)
MITCGGRFRLGVGVGDEEIEFQLLGEDYHTRGARFEEQVAVLRRSWKGDGEPFVGRWHNLPPIDVVGPPRAHPIPLWITAGDHSPQHVLERIGRLADGVIPPWDPGEHARASLEVIFEAARRAGRDPTKLGLEPKVALRTGKRMRWRDSSRKDAEVVAAELRSWLDLGATHIEFKTRRSGFRNLDEHVAAMAELQEIFHSCTS